MTLSRLVAVAAFSSALLTISAQNHTAFHSGPIYCTHLVIGPANDDPSAITDEQIFAVNQRLAAAGNTKAALQLGLAYLQGVGVGQDFKAAEKWFRNGAVTPQDKAFVGRFYGRGECFTKDIAKADYWLRAAGRPGDLFELAGMYRDAGPSYTSRAASIYVALLSNTGDPNVRLARLELGNFVLDGKYSSGDTVDAQAQNLGWAHAITQELLGQVEYTIAVSYSAKVEGVPENSTMWLRFCRRAAAYDNDLAQEFYANALFSGEVPNGSPPEGAAWMRLSSDKRYQNRNISAQWNAKLSPEQRMTAQTIYEDLLRTKDLDGAYYPASDPLREPTDEALRAMSDDDPDVQVRRAFALSTTGKLTDYHEALRLYRIARDRREMDVRVVLGREYLMQKQPTEQSAWLAKHWFTMAANFGSKPAALYLARWYRGEGGGTADPVQAYTWQWLGTEVGPKPTPDGLTDAQGQAAEQQISSWRAQHSGW